MTAVETTQPTASTEHSESKPPRLTWHGVKTVTQLELMQRIRSTKWKRMLLLWFIGVGAICVLFSTTVQAMVANGANESVGPIIFATNVFFILFMGLLVTPSLSSTAINGDRERGTLAIQQASLLTPLEITLGKLAASWLAALSFLFISTPFILWAFAAGQVTARAVISSILTMALVLLVVCAVSLYFSARAPRSASSTMSSYGFVALISIISFLVYLLLMGVSGTTKVIDGYTGANFDSQTGNPTTCVAESQEFQDLPTEYLWPLLAINPFVLVADVTTPPIEQYTTSTSRDSVMGTLASVVREVRLPIEENYSFDGWCTPDGELRTLEEVNEQYRTKNLGDPVWYLGIPFYLLIGGLAVWRTTKRLETPYTKLHKGIRIA